MHKQTPADYRKLSSKITKRGKIERYIPQIAQTQMTPRRLLYYFTPPVQAKLPPAPVAQSTCCPRKARPQVPPPPQAATSSPTSHKTPLLFPTLGCDCAPFAQQRHPHAETRRAHRGSSQAQRRAV